MITAATLAPPTWTAADLVDRFGPIPLHRICFDPFPGTATEQDVIDFEERENRLFELVDGILVEKTMGIRESILAVVLSTALRNYLTGKQLGTVTAPDGTMRLAPGLVRIPDVAFISWDRFPNRQVQATPIPDLAPDLAVEVLSPSNTAAEMRRKLHDYFTAGCPLVWFVDPETRTATIYTAADQSTTLEESQALEGGAVLPGFVLPLRQLFAELDPH